MSKNVEVKGMVFIMLSDLIGLVGIIVGIIGCKSLSNVKKIQTKEISNSTVNQSESMIIYNGLDRYAVIKIAEDVIKNELLAITNNLAATTLDLVALRTELDAMPKFHCSNAKPNETIKNNDFYCKY